MEAFEPKKGEGFGKGPGAYDATPEIPFGLMFHGFDYPDETGRNELHARFWRPVMKAGVIGFVRPENCPTRRFVREMVPKHFEPDRNFTGLEEPGLLEETRA